MTGREPDPAADPTVEPGAPRPMIERLGLGAIAIVLAALFAAMGLGAFEHGEVFLGVMAAIAVLMTLWAAASTLFRG